MNLSAVRGLQHTKEPTQNAIRYDKLSTKHEDQNCDMKHTISQASPVNLGLP